MLSSPTGSEIGNFAEVIVIGCGYGAAVSAARLSEAGYEVVVLERGREYDHGKFPETGTQGLRELQLNTLPFGLRNRLGLVDVKVFEDVCLMAGCGLGGSSLINAGVMERAAPEVFQSRNWPRQIRENPELLEPHYQKALTHLKVAAYPEGKPGFPKLNKAQALRSAAQSLGLPARQAEVSIHFDAAGMNEYGIFRQPCIACGNCLTGCNHEAKNSLDTTYLAQAREYGARIHTQIYVSHLRKLDDGRYAIFYQFLRTGREQIDAGRLRIVVAKYVVLGAGSPGSTEILFRSRLLGGLRLSSRLGERFSVNGATATGSIYSDLPVHNIGLEPKSRPNKRVDTNGSPPEGQNRRRPTWQQRLLSKYRFREPVGPTITTMIDGRGRPESPDNDLVVEDAALSGVFARIAPVWFTGIGLAARGFDPDEFNRAEIKSTIRSLLTNSAYAGFVPHAQILLGVTHDGAAGRLLPDNPINPLLSEARVHWPGLRSSPHYDRLHGLMRRIMNVHGHPVTEVSSQTGGRPMSVHPLGGCSMGDEVTTGVVNHACEVFNPETGNLHEGLLVCDASILPRSLGINPAATITALAERSMEIFLQKHGTHKDRQTTQADRRGETIDDVTKVRRTGFPALQFEETLGGYWSAGATDAQLGESAGKFKGLNGRLQINCTVEIDDLDVFLADPEHTGRLIGFVDCPGLDREGPLPIQDGEFRLFSRKPERVNTKYMYYTADLLAASGLTYRLRGVKEIHRDRIINALADLTTLKCEIFRLHETNNESLIGRGIVHVKLSDFFSQSIGTLRAPAAGIVDGLGARARFASFFQRELYDGYAPVVAPRGLARLTPPPSPIPKHTEEGIVNADIKNIPFITPDGLALNLKRVSRKNHGDAVLLIHGLSSSCDMFIMPEHKNITNTLLDQGYEVWLLDFRMSNRFLYNTMAHDYTMDEIALFDMKTTIEIIRDSIGATRKLHVIAHCLGSFGFSMALFGGILPPITSFITNSVSLLPRVHWQTRLKFDLFLQSGLIERVLRMPYVDHRALHSDDIVQKLLGYGVSLAHPECDNAVCHMLSFIWGTGNPGLFLHKNLHPLTHDRLGDLFGPVGYSYQRHVMAMSKVGRPFKSHDTDPRFAELPFDILTEAEKNTTPVLFISGSENCIFSNSNQRTHAMLFQKRPDLYDYHSFANYGHQDVFQGRDAAQDIFPTLLAWLGKH